MSRPPFHSITSAAEFDSWYWLKAELVDICQASELPTTGNKRQLRERILYALEHDGAVMPEPASAKPISTFDWAKAELTPETVITDNVSFGPNFRRFMQTQVSRKFSCTGEFMAWVRDNTGATLADAAAYWEALRARNKDPDSAAGPLPHCFVRDIAEDNQYNRYTRAFLDDNPGLTPADARKYWLLKRAQPAPGGRVVYARGDLELGAE